MVNLPQIDNAPVLYPTIYHFGTECCAHFCSRDVRCGIRDRCTGGIVNLFIPILQIVISFIAGGDIYASVNWTSLALATMAGRLVSAKPLREPLRTYCTAGQDQGGPFDLGQPKMCIACHMCQIIFK